MQLHNKVGWFVFSDVDIQASDIPDEPIEFEGQKTPSKQLHDVLFRLHEKQGGKPEDFESYRRRIMTKLVNHYKAMLDEID